MTELESRYAILCAEVDACQHCPGMAERRRVLSPANGPLDAPVLFVAEAPGRLGADRTGIPLSGDASGQRFDALLAAVGWQRTDVFVTNAVLCNPRTPDGRRNRPPSRPELDACAGFLRRQIELLTAPVIAPLGAVALSALNRLSPHGLTLATAAAHPIPWHGRWLFPLYHPGPRAVLHRSDAAQIADMRALRRFVDGLPEHQHVPPDNGGNRRNCSIILTSV